MRAVNFALNGINTVNLANGRPTMTKDYYDVNAGREIPACYPRKCLSSIPYVRATVAIAVQPL